MLQLFRAKHIQVMASTRSSAKVFWKVSKNIFYCEAAIERGCTQIFHFHRLEENECINDSVRISVKAVFDILQSEN